MKSRVGCRKSLENQSGFNLGNTQLFQPQDKLGQQVFLLLLAT